MKQQKKLCLPQNLFMIIYGLVCLIPFILIIAISLSNEKDIVKYGYQIIPKSIDFTAYQYIFKNPYQILNSYMVTIITAVLGTFLSVLIMILIAYPLSKRDYKHRKQVSFIVFFTMLFSGGLVPTYILVSQYLNMKDTIWALMIPGLVNAWHVILLRTFFQSLPSELFDAAKIDGCNEFGILFKIVVPLSKPSIATIALLGLLIRWNDWMNCMLYINKESLVTLQYMLQRIMKNIEVLRSGLVNLPQGLENSIDIPSETTRMAMAVLAVGPMVFVFPFFQKYFVRGLTVGSVKG